MNKEKRENQEPIFPAPFEYFEDLIADDLKLRKELEEELKRVKQNYRPPKSYKLDFQPPGTQQDDQNKNYDVAIEKLQIQIKNLGSNVVEVLSKESAKLELDDNQINEVNDILYQKMFPDPFKDKGALEKKNIITQSKGLDEAQHNLYYVLKRVKENKPYKSFVQSKSKDDFSPDRD